MKTDSLVDKYLKDQDFSETTKAGYRRDILAFFKFSGGEMPAADNVRAWRQSLEDKGRSSSHIARCMFGLKGFCEWNEIHIFAGPREKSKNKVRAPSLSFKAPPETRSVADIQKMLEACRTPRERLMLMFLVTTGARISELMHIRLDDIDWKVGTVMITRKGRKGRKQEIAISPAVLEVIKEWLEWRHTRSQMLLPFSYSELRHSFLNLAKRARVQFPRGSLFHNLRHFFVLFQKDAGTDIGYISLAAGHTSRQITERVYGAQSPEKIKAQLHPQPWEISSEGGYGARRSPTRTRSRDSRTNHKRRQGLSLLGQALQRGTCELPQVDPGARNDHPSSTADPANADR